MELNKATLMKLRNEKIIKLAPELILFVDPSLTQHYLVSKISKWTCMN